MNKSLTFKEYLNKKLLPYKVIIPLSLALIAAVISAYTMLTFYSNLDISFAKAIGSHISVLIETQDGPELQRFITAVSKEKGIKIEVSKNNEIIASTANIAEIGKKQRKITPYRMGSKIKFSSNFLISTIPIKRINGPMGLVANIRLYNPTSRIFFIIISISTIIFLGSFLVLNILATKIINTAQKSIEPIKELENSIVRLKNFEDIHSFDTRKHVLGNSKYINELENIYKTILVTNTKLRESNDKLASSKARELTVSAYKKLIHDLHTPVAALKQMTKIINKKNITQDKKEFAKIRIAEIAEQILSQIKTSKENLKVEITPQKDDLNECVRQASEQAQMALIEKENVDIIEKYDDSIKAFQHDSIMLGRAISNLIVNAIEACKKLVEISVQKIEKEISISISDDGEGIKQEDISLFLHGRGKSNKKDGLGIGLSSANHIVRLHGGRIIYRRSHLGGACFDIRMEG